MAAADPILLAAAVLVIAAVLVSSVSVRFGVPAVLIFLLLGMAAGSEGVGQIDFTDFGLAQGVGIVALAFILFSGGFDTDRADVRPVLRPAVVLATLGVALTAGLVGVVAAAVLDLPLEEGLLLGAIISSTDAAAVFATLRARSISLQRPLRPLLEMESGSNDPMAVFLTIGLIELIGQPDTGVEELLLLLARQALIGGALGWAFGRGAVAAINRLRLEYEGLYPVLALGIVSLTYATTALLGGSGFLAVYVAGMIMGNTPFLHRKSLGRFLDAIAWLMQIAVFLVLGLLAFPSRLLEVAPRALLVSVVLILLARPIAVLIGLAGTRLSLRAKLLVSWVGLRGAVPVVLATFPLVEGVPSAALIFDVVFFIVLTSVLVQGTTISPVARWLGVDAPHREHRAPPLEFVPTAGGTTDLHEVPIPPGSPVVGRALVELGLPNGALIVLINRDDEFVVPQGATVLQAGDDVLLLADATTLAEAMAIIGEERLA
jgi:cell volume regulation protein A